jgi:hypothetical protein
MSEPYSATLRKVINKEKYNNGYLRTSLKMPEKAKTCRGTTTCLHIIISNYTASVATHTVMCLTAQNRDNFKLAASTST